MNISYRRWLRLLPIGCILLIFAVMNFTDPTQSIASILLVFLLLYLLVVSLLYELMHRYWHKIVPGGAGQLSKTRSYYLASALAFLPVSILAMQSLQQIRPFDIVLVVVLLAIVLFYIVKRTS